MTSLRLVRPESLDDPRLDAYARLTNHQLRNRLEPERGIVVVESRLAIQVALAEGVEPLSFLVEDSRLDSVRDLLAGVGDDVPVYVLPHGEISRLTGYNVTRGLLCAARRPQARTPGEVLAGARHVVVLEGLVDVTNVGAAFRSSAALGADAVLLAPTCADPLERRGVRVSMGTVFQVPWARVEGPWPAAGLELLHGRGFDCWALALDEGASALGSVRPDPGRGLALFFGNEGAGLAHETVAGCDRVVTIPMAHGVDSLNVAASSAVALWELFARPRS